MILAHYMPWFVAKPFSTLWGWHWTMNSFKPDEIRGSVRNIASRYYPLIGPYDSGDPNVIEYHLLLMKLAGIDGVIVDWYGLSDLYDYPLIQRNTQALFAPAAKLGLKIGICYEDQTITNLVKAGKLTEAERVPRAKSEIDWLRKNWFNRPNYLTLSGKPVLLSFGAGNLTDAEWEQALPASDTSIVYLSEHRRRANAAGAFDWPIPQRGMTAVDTFYQENGNGRVVMPVAFPRFDDVYKEGKAQEGYPQIPDEQGRTFTTTLERALKSRAPLIQLATWNDWGEGTNLEPSREFPYRDLEAVQRLRQRYTPSGFRATPDDLRLPLRLYTLRQKQTRQPRLKAELDTIASLIASGNRKKATANLTKLEKTNG